MVRKTYFTTNTRQIRFTEAINIIETYKKKKITLWSCHYWSVVNRQIQRKWSTKRMN